MIFIAFFIIFDQINAAIKQQKMQMTESTWLITIISREIL